MTPKMAMRIGGKYKFSEVKARHWEQFAESAGLARAQTRRRIVALAKALPATACNLKADTANGFAGNALVDRIIAVIEQRCALTIRLLTDAIPEDDAADDPPT